MKYVKPKLKVEKVYVHEGGKLSSVHEQSKKVTKKVVNKII